MGWLDAVGLVAWTWIVVRLYDRRAADRAGATRCEATGCRTRYTRPVVWNVDGCRFPARYLCRRHYNEAARAAEAAAPPERPIIFDPWE